MQTDCIISRFEYTVSLWCPDQDIRNYYPKTLNYFGIIIINWTKEGVPPQLTRRRAPMRAFPPPTTHTQTSNNEGAPPPQLTRRRRCPPTTHTQTRVFTRHPHTDEGVPPAIHAKTKVFPSPLTHRRECFPAIRTQTRVFPPPFTYRRMVFPRPTHADDNAPISPHPPDRPEKRGYPNKRKPTFKLLDVLISSRLQVLDKTFCPPDFFM